MFNSQETTIIIMMLFCFTITLVGNELYKIYTEVKSSHISYEPNKKLKYKYEILIKKFNEPGMYALNCYSYSRFSKEEVVYKSLNPKIYDFCLVDNVEGNEKVRVEAKEIDYIIIKTYSLKDNIKLAEDEFTPIQWSLLSDINKFSLESNNLYETVRKRLYDNKNSLYDI